MVDLPAAAWWIKPNHDCSKFETVETESFALTLFLDRVSTGSDSDLVSDQHAKLPWFDQVATAPCTDPIQVRFLLLGQCLGV